MLRGKGGHVKVLVAAGAGYVGSHVVDELVAVRLVVHSGATGGERLFRMRPATDTTTASSQMMAT